MTSTHGTQEALAEAWNEYYPNHPIVPTDVRMPANFSEPGRHVIRVPTWHGTIEFLVGEDGEGKIGTLHRPDDGQDD